MKFEFRSLFQYAVALVIVACGTSATTEVATDGGSSGGGDANASSSSGGSSSDAAGDGNDVGDAGADSNGDPTSPWYNCSYDATSWTHEAKCPSITIEAGAGPAVYPVQCSDAEDGGVDPTICVSICDDAGVSNVGPRACGRALTPDGGPGAFCVACPFGG